APVEIGEGCFGGRDEPEVLLRVVIEVLAELRQVARAEEVLLAHHEGRIDLGVAVLTGMDIEHEVDEGALKAGATALEDVGAGAGNLYAALEIDDAQLLA